MAYPRHQKMTEGPISAVKCPWCGQHNDCREIADQLETGTQFICDHCGNLCVIKGVSRQPRIRLQQVH